MKNTKDGNMYSWRVKNKQHVCTQTCYCTGGKNIRGTVLPVGEQETCFGKIKCIILHIFYCTEGMGELDDDLYCTSIIAD